MQTQISKLAWLAIVAALVVCPLGWGQENPLEAARQRVIADLVESLPPTMPDGGLAILPCEVADREMVDGLVSTTWPTAVAEAVHKLRPDVVLTDREHLAAVLREQKFGDSAFADPDTAAEVGKLVAARSMLLTTLHEFRLRGGRVRVSLEASLIDVETGRNLWSRAYTRGIFPFWAKALLVVFLVVLALLGWRIWDKRRRTVLVEEKLPREKAGVRVDVDGLARSAVEARERLHDAGNTEAAAKVQKAWVTLDATLDRVRHALPGGTVDSSRARDLAAAIRQAERLAVILGALRTDCDRMRPGESEGRSLAQKIAAADAEVRAAVDAFRRHMA